LHAQTINRVSYRGISLESDNRCYVDQNKIIRPADGSRFTQAERPRLAAPAKLLSVRQCEELAGEMPPLPRANVVSASHVSD
jgi:hypothetical protein